MEIRTDLTRIIAIGLILFSHGYTALFCCNYGILSSYFMNFHINSFGIMGATLFIICSGNGLRLKEKINLKEKLFKLYPVFIISFLLCQFIPSYNFPTPSNIYTLITTLTLTSGLIPINQNNGIYWFIPVLFGLYLLFPSIQKLTKSKKGIIFLIIISYIGYTPLILYLFFNISIINLTGLFIQILFLILPFIMGILSSNIKRKYGLLILLIPLTYLFKNTTLLENFFILLCVPFIAYGIFSLTVNTIKTEWSNTTLIIYLIHGFFAFSLTKIYGFWIYPLSIPLILFLSWHLTKLNNKFYIKIKNQFIKANLI